MGRNGMRHNDVCMSYEKHEMLTNKCSWFAPGWWVGADARANFGSSWSQLARYQSTCTLQWSTGMGAKHEPVAFFKAAGQEATAF